MKSKNVNMFSKIFVWQLIFILGGGFTYASAQEILNKIDAAQEFKSLDKDINSALTNQVDVLSPRNFKMAHAYLEEAKKNLDKQKELAKEIHDKVTRARDYLNNANEMAKISHKHIEDVVIARQQAVAAGAPVFFTDDFKNADDLLLKVTSDLEHNNTENAYKNREALQNYFSNLELRSIKHQNLAHARLTFIQAIKDGAKKYVPEKLKAALKNYKETSTYITEHRHDVDQIQARSLAVDESANQILQSTHDLAASNMSPNGSSDSVVAIEDNEKLEDQIRTQQSAVANEQKTIKSLEEKVEALESEKAIYDKIEKTRNKFTSNEAEIYRQGNIIIIRLKGLKFPVAKAVLNQSNLQLLAKVQRVVKDFNKSTVVVEGHTDSIGSKNLNEKLSKERAETVRNYLLSLDVMTNDKIKAIGRGEAVPLANNKTPEGRAQNRRADILIKL